MPLKQSQRTRILCALAFTLAAAGCSTVPLDFDPAHTDPTDACRGYFEHMDAEVRAAGVRDGAAVPIPGFPWLRASRALASFAEEAAEGDHQFDAWIERLSALDQEGRKFEFLNLQEVTQYRLRQGWQEAASQYAPALEPLAVLDECRERLNARLRSDPGARRELRENVVVPDDYVLWQRVVGLYPVARRIVRPRILALHERLEERFATGVSGNALTVHHAVSSAKGQPAPATATFVAQGLPRDALGIPLPDEAGRATLMDFHAPIWAIETLRKADLPGALVFAAESRGLRPVVDTDRPLEYRWLSWTRFGGDVLLQLNYALWFPQRPPAGRFDITAGHLDGVVWRVTLDRNGTVLAYDSIHSCGCYYTLLPAPGLQAVTAAGDEEPLFVPHAAPVPGEGERVLVGLESGTHFVVEVGVRTLGPETRPLTPAPMAKLRSLPTPRQARASVYRPDGLIPASRRPERFVLWPLGVPSAGAMRQPGRQPTAFIGRRHFDDARLFEELLREEPVQ